MEENDAEVADEHKGVSGRQAALQFVKVSFSPFSYTLIL
jgi:hypothetical protein